MNPLFVILVFILAFFIWAFCIAFLFPVIGKFFKEYFNAMKSIITDKEDNDE